MARKSKYTSDVIKRLVEAIELGATYELACHYAGISFQTFNEWQKTKPEFLETIKAAEGLAIVGWLYKIEQAAKDGNWQAAAWKLERRYPDLYGRPGILKHEVSGPNGGSIPVEFVARAAIAEVAAGSITDSASAE